MGRPKEVTDDEILVAAAGPDERPIREQLVMHAKVTAVFCRDLQAGYGILMAAGIKPHRTRKEESAPEHAYRALVAWLKTAQRQGRRNLVRLMPTNAVTDIRVA